jgi:hypothetical protein
MKTKTLDLDKLDSKDPKIKYGFAKELIKIGKSDPKLLYDYFDFWASLITSDRDDRLPGQIENLFKILHSGNLITCNHAVFALGLLAKNIPTQRTRIIKELVTISRDTFETEECRAIATGKVIETIKDFTGEIVDNQDVLEFIKKAQFSQRNATKKKAESLMIKLTK